MSLIEDFCTKNKILDYSINQDKISVDGNVDLSFLEVEEVPYEFEEVSGDFICPKSIKSLKNTPRVCGSFFVKDCFNLKSLEGSPEEFFNYDCSGCTFQQFDRCPQKVEGSFTCNRCLYLKTLEGGPVSVGENYSCMGCDSLISLVGSPETLNGSFYCGSCNSLHDLKGAPKQVEDFSCVYCTELTSLKGAPKKVFGNFSCSGCRSLVCLDGAPRETFGDFYCVGCGKVFTKSQFPKNSCVIKYIYY